MVLVDKDAVSLVAETAVVLTVTVGEERGVPMGLVVVI